MKSLKFDIYKENGVYYHDGDEHPPVIKVCKCEQCRYSKNKRHNKNARNQVKRWLNKKRRKKSGGNEYFMWA